MAAAALGRVSSAVRTLWNGRCESINTSLSSLMASFLRHASTPMIVDQEAPSQVPTPHLSNLDSGAMLSDEGLPAYSEVGQTARPLTQHTFHYQKDGRTWLKLNVASCAPSDKHLPAFIGPSRIMGTIQVDLAKPESLLAIKIRLTGSVNCILSSDTPRFLNMSQTLWTARTGESSLIGRLRLTEGQKVEGKLELPFSFQMPEQVSVPPGSNRKSMWEGPLPSSFMELGAGLSVVYTIEVSVKRGLFGVDSRLSTKITYAPFTQPECFSILRQAQYQRGIGQIAPPEEDPSGWTTLGPTIISGRLFDTREASISCVLSLAKPLTYTRGSCIPIHLTISTSDSQALDLLSQPVAPVVKLLAYLEVNADTPWVKSLGLTERGDGRVFLESRAVQNAVWWIDPAPVPIEKGERRLFGEIHLPFGATPPFDIPDVRLRYRVALMPFSVAGFVAPKKRQTFLGPAYRALVTQEIDIVTAYAGVGSGHKPVPVTSPAYTKPNPWPLSSARENT